MRSICAVLLGAASLALGACTALPQGPSSQLPAASGLIQKLPDEIVSNNSNSLVMTLSNGAAYSTMAAPTEADITHVRVAFDQVMVHYDASASVDTPPATESADADAGWLTFPASASETIDLVGLAPDSLFGASSSLAVGTYTQIRLAVKAAELTFADESTASLDIASGNLKIIRPFEIKPRTKTILHFDFDTARSIHKAGATWKLRPTAIKTIPTYEALPEATESATATAS